MSPSYTFTRRMLGYYFCAATIVICALWLNLRGYSVIQSNASVPDWGERHFSFLEDDHPRTLIPPSRHPRNVALITEETVYYSHNASQDWESMLPSGSEGFVRLGPQMRLFGVSMYHQLHCLHMLQQSTTHTLESGKFDLGHLHHCLNYLRVTFLCAANVRLEPLMDDGSGVPKTDGIGLEHRCRDWTLVRREVEANFQHWSWEDEQS